MLESLLESRLEFAFRYLKFDAQAKKLDWLGAVELIGSDPSFKLPELMVLIHPRYQRSFKLESSQIYGAPSFTPAGPGAKCRAKEIWGYNCPFIEARIHIDHSFPRSRGGATHSKNAMYLCDQHNLPKSDDIHLYPWENLPQKLDWVESVLQQFSFAETRNSGKQPHFSKQKFKLT